MVRFQLDLTQEEHDKRVALVKSLGYKRQVDMYNEAYALFEYAVAQLAAGKDVMSIDPATKTIVDADPEVLRALKAKLQPKASASPAPQEPDDDITGQRWADG
ncbi:MAG: hypothetical protein WAX89_06410 [Alphaproteobacteria bacterium]